MTNDSDAGSVAIPAAEAAGKAPTSGTSIGPNGHAEEFKGTDDHELSTIAKRFLIAEVNRLVEENRQLRQFKDKYHDVDKKLATLKETHRPFRTNEFLSSVCLIAGSAGLGSAPSFLSLNSYGWYIFLIVSALLLISGIAAKVYAPGSGVATRH
jgi:hypothetical protein